MYGLADAPLRWRKTLKSYLTETLNYKAAWTKRSSRYTYKASWRGVKEHQNWMQRLQERFRFIWPDPRTQQAEDFTISVDM